MLRWVPAALLALGHLVLWPLFVLHGLRAVIAWIFLLVLLPALGAVTLLAVTVYAAAKRRVSAPLGCAAVLSLAALWPGLWNFGALTITFPFSIESNQPAATVRLPSNQPLRVAWGGDSVATNYHAASPDQRWAYDLVVEPYFVESKRLEDYGCFGTPVVAPIDAKVHVAHDGEDDRVPGEMVGASPLGNHVVLELPTHTFLLIAHLRKGSVVVKEGERLREGDVLGQCGNSGHTSEPHIHIHHQRQDPKVFPTSFAEGLPLYFRDSDGPPMPSGGLAKSGDKVVPTGAIVRHVGP